MLIAATGAIASPKNDSCRNPIPIEDGVYAFNTESATTDGPDHDIPFCDITYTNPITNDIWYSFSSNTDKIVELSLCEGTDFDTIMIRHHTCDCPEGFPNSGTCDDDGCTGLSGGASHLIFYAFANECRLIQIGGLNGAAGNGTLSVTTQGQVENDYCEDAIPISEGDYVVRAYPAHVEGPNQPDICYDDLGPFGTDVWYDYVAPEDGLVTISFCDDTVFETQIAVFRGCGCPVSNDMLIACDDSGCSDFEELFFSSAAKTTFRVHADECYKVRINAATFDLSQSGLMHVGPVEQGTNCPAGLVWFGQPFQSSVVDAREPHALNDPESLEGIQTFQVQALPGADPECWSVYEVNPPLGPNSVVGATFIGTEYTIQLARPITIGGTTFLIFEYEGAPACAGSLVSLPGDVNSDAQVNESDIISLIDCLNGIDIDDSCPYGLYNSDIDHSGQANPADILRLIDLLNGAESFDPWLGAELPAAFCPH